jgi:transketolase
MIVGAFGAGESSMLSDHALRLKSIEYRKKILAVIRSAQAGHMGGSLSCVDILNVLYNAAMNVRPENFGSPDRDRYVQSKGHSVEALYVVLADKGFFCEEELETLSKYKSHFVGHPTRKVPGIEHNTGALGHGLSFAVGQALAGKKDGRSYKVYVLLGDGELAEGSNWEASSSAVNYGLDNLVALVDRNGFQITGATERVYPLEPLEDKFRAFGYAVRTVDGNNVAELRSVLRESPFEKERPSLILARTTKGKGISFMENVAAWHHRVPNDDEYTLAIRELEDAEIQLRGEQ